MRIAAAGLAALLLLAGCDQYDSAREAVRLQMKDPDATQFKELRFCGDDPADPQRVITGKYNGKNSYGAYEGFENFYYADGQPVELGSDASRTLFDRCLKQIESSTARIRAKMR